jgi:hypothetical protein
MIIVIGKIGLGKPLSRCHDGDDAHDGHLRAYSRAPLPLTGIGLGTTVSGIEMH